MFDIAIPPQPRPPASASVVWSLLWLSALLLCVGSTASRAAPAQGSLALTVLINNSPARARIRVNRSGGLQQVWSSLYKHGGPALQTPLTIPLPAGSYDVLVTADPGKGIESHLRQRTLPVRVVTGQQHRERVNFPVAHLRVGVDAGDSGDGSPLKGAALAIAPGWLDEVTGSRYQKLPFEFALSPGKYTLLVIDTRSRVRKLTQITLKPGQQLDQTVRLDPAHVGTLDIQLVMDGQPVPARDAARYVEVDIISSQTRQPVRPLSGGYGYPAVLPSGRYDVSVHSHSIGATLQQLKDIPVGNGQNVVRRITIQRPGTLVIHGRWHGQATNLADCTQYYNIFNKAHLGALMGGPSPSRGGCANPVVGNVVVRLSSDAAGDGDVTETSAAGPLQLPPGNYTLAAWPADHPELRQTLERVRVSAGTTVEKTLNFRWPD